MKKIPESGEEGRRERGGGEGELYYSLSELLGALQELLDFAVLALSSLLPALHRGGYTGCVEGNLLGNLSLLVSLGGWRGG